MANKTPDQLTAAASVADTDLVMVYPSGGPLKKVTFLNFVASVGASLGAGGYLESNNNLSDLASASSARANLGLGTAAVLASSAVFQVANNLSEVANAATARTNIGAAASVSPTITGGMTFSGASRLNVQALGALDIDWSLAEVQTKSISSNSTFTFSGITASKAQAVILILTITSAAVPSWPAAVVHDGGADLSATLGNGTHWIALITGDGGTSVLLKIIARNAS